KEDSLVELDETSLESVPPSRADAVGDAGGPTAHRSVQANAPSHAHAASAPPPLTKAAAAPRPVTRTQALAGTTPLTRFSKMPALAPGPLRASKSPPPPPSSSSAPLPVASTPPQAREPDAAKGPWGALHDKLTREIVATSSSLPARSALL